MRIKKSIIILLIVTIILGISFTVKAAEGDSYIIKLSADKTTLKAGDTITISLKLDNIKIQSGEKGLGSYEGSIVYDKNVFEGLKMTGNSDWDTPFENEGRFTAARSDGECVSEAQNIAIITLKVKSDAKEGNTKIEIKNFSASNAVENIATADTSLTIKIEKENKDNKTEETDNKNNTTDNNTSIAENKTTNSTENKTQNKITNNISNKATNSTIEQKKNIVNASIAKGKLPKTGLSTTLGIFIIISIISGIYGYEKYKRMY